MIMKHSASRIMACLSRVGIALTKERLRSELMMVDDRVLASAGLTRQGLLDSIQSWHCRQTDEDRQLLA